jgi:hypothetical protein
MGSISSMGSKGSMRSRGSMGSRGWGFCSGLRSMDLKNLISKSF